MNNEQIKTKIDELENEIGKLENLREKHCEYKCYSLAEECDSEISKIESLIRKLEGQLGIVYFDFGTPFEVDGIKWKIQSANPCYTECSAVPTDFKPKEDLSGVEKFHAIRDQEYSFVIRNNTIIKKGKSYNYDEMFK